MNKNDLRYIKTEEIIRTTFMKCVYEKGFKATHISDICHSARISRNTFYSHYIDKYDLLDALFKELQDYFDQSFTDEMGNDLFRYEFDSSIHWYMHVIDKNWKYYKLLLECSYERFLDVTLETIVLRPLRKYFPSLDTIICEDIALRLNVKYMFYGMTAFTKTWLDNYDKISLQEAINEMRKLCITPVTLLIEKLEKYKK